jgi:hypothetical protein
MFKINQIKNTRSIISYDYSYSKKIRRFFNNNTFFVEYSSLDITNVPDHIKIIPLIANIAPISWFVGFDIYIEEIDEKFYESLLSIKQEFKKYYPTLIKETEIKYNTLRNTEYKADKSAMLFSGGVDAYTTYFRHCDENLDLITIQGADISIGDIKQWNKVVSLFENESMQTINNNKFYIKSNIRDFYSFEVDKLLPNLGWWGLIQHGLSITALTAPLSFINGYKNIYIASSYTRRPNYKFIPWGSMPEIDNKIAWAKTSVIHDGAELTRQDKIETIVTSTRKMNCKINLRVCYSENNTNINCSCCEKCLRTIFGIMIAGANPIDYGFDVDISIYSKIKAVLNSGFKTYGCQLFWAEMFYYASSNNNFFILEQSDTEMEKYKEILEILSVHINSDLKPITKSQKIKLNIISKYPKLFQIYLALRKK